MGLALGEDRAQLQLSSVSIAGLESWMNSSSTQQTADRFLRVQVGADVSCLVAAEDVVAVQTITIAEIVLVPHMPAWVLGFCRWQGQPLWLIDLAQQMQVGSLVQSDQSRTAFFAILVKQRAQVVGLIVPEVHDIESYSPNALSSPSTDVCSPTLLPFIKGYFSNRHCIVLDLSAVFKNLSQSVNSF